MRRTIVALKVTGFAVATVLVTAVPAFAGVVIGD